MAYNLNIMYIIILTSACKRKAKYRNVKQETLCFLNLFSYLSSYTGSKNMTFSLFGKSNLLACIENKKNA